MFGIGGSDETFSNEKIPYSGVKECLDVLSPMDALSDTATWPGSRCRPTAMEVRMSV